MVLRNYGKEYKNFQKKEEEKERLKTLRQEEHRMNNVRIEARNAAQLGVLEMRKSNLLEKLKNWQQGAREKSADVNSKLLSIDSSANLLAPSFPAHSGVKLVKSQRFGHNPAAAANMINATRRFTLEQAS